jgi:hypothetical protein
MRKHENLVWTHIYDGTRTRARVLLYASDAAVPYDIGGLEEKSWRAVTRPKGLFSRREWLMWGMLEARRG